MVYQYARERGCGYAMRREDVRHDHHLVQYVTEYDLNWPITQVALPRVEIVHVSDHRSDLKTSSSHGI